jgi:hypothetical protein
VRVFGLSLVLDVEVDVCSLKPPERWRSKSEKEIRQAKQGPQSKLREFKIRRQVVVVEGAPNDSSDGELENSGTFRAR